MKKYAFTLAETLMTMAIIGVCAALMITSIKNVNPTGQADAIMAKKAVTTFADSTRQIMVHYAKNFKMNDVYSDKEKTEPCKNATCLFNIYGKFVQITKQLSADEAGNFGASSSVYGQLVDGLVFGVRYDPTACSISTSEADNIYASPADDSNGATTTKLIVSGACGMIYYDTNGKKGPNVNGKDRFAIPIFKSTGARIPSPKASEEPTT